MKGMYRIAALALVLTACGAKNQDATKVSFPVDHHSYAKPEQARANHLELDLTVDFDKKVLAGTALYSVDGSKQLILDTKDLSIQSVTASADGAQFKAAGHVLGASDKILGAPLTIDLAEGTRYVKVKYETSPTAAALQWLSPAQTAGKTAPYLYTQSQPIYARSWIPIQDSPSIRLTYKARVHTPPNFFAVMSASNDQKTMAPTGNYEFNMPQSIPPYLMALAVGEIQYRSMGAMTGVYTEKAMLDAASTEFFDTEPMLQATKQLFGDYRWERYDLLVLPPGFPIGGMENPRLTFLTPTLIAGDKSLVSVVAHELAHSWSGNLVTNATWSDFWLNEGFTVYVERRIQEQVFGARRAEMEFAIEIDELKKEMATLAPRDQMLYVDLKGRDPEEGITLVPYVKGALLLKAIEDEVGRERFDPFLRGYFDHFAFQSITTQTFEEYLKKAFPELKLNLDSWIRQPGLPASTPKITSYLLTEVDDQIKKWAKGEAVVTRDWVAGQWLHFLRGLPDNLSSVQMAKLDAQYSFTASKNAEIMDAWLILAIRHKYAPAQARLEEFLSTVGRQKFIKPLYAELAKTPEGKTRAQALFTKYKANYHSIAVSAVEALLAK